MVSTALGFEYLWRHRVTKNETNGGIELLAPLSCQTPNYSELFHGLRLGLRLLGGGQFRELRSRESS